ncbi:MAG TPA: GNAT family N-acetyltransferase, partial [Gammaproteobacteria bacterium]|nr:GNAT family N-acetyltransferase [Gammaproteobacteria bacterium]
MSVSVRRAAHEDAAAIAPLVTQLGYPSAAAEVEARLARLKDHPDIRAYVAESEGRLVGIIGLMVFPAFHRDGLHGYVTALVVDEGVRGSGVGGALLETAEAWFQERGVKRVSLTTALHREDAHVFY